MQLRDLIGGHPQMCGPELSLAEASRAMRAAGVGSLGVVRDRELIGIITERDILHAVAADVDADLATVSEWMSNPVQTFDEDTSVDEAALHLLEHDHRHMPVVVDGRLLSILSIRDVLAALVEPDRR